MDKERSLNIRFTTIQLRKIRDAARIETRRRGEKVKPSPLVRELVMPRVEQILAGAAEASAA